MRHQGPWFLLLKQEWGDIDSCNAIESDSNSDSDSDTDSNSDSENDSDSDSDSIAGPQFRVKIL